MEFAIFGMFLIKMQIIRRNAPGLLLGLISVLITACSMDASVELVDDLPGNVPVDTIRGLPEITKGEPFTTTNGYKLIGIFEEVPERQTLSNGYQIDGSFYEE